MYSRWTVSVVTFFFLVISNDTLKGETDRGIFWKNRFIITELKPIIDPQAERYEQVYMCAESRIHQIEMEPSPKSGITKTRVAVRAVKEGSVYLLLDDQKPGYRMFQIFTRGFILRALSWAGAEHVLIGPVSFSEYQFHGDPKFPLHFKHVPDVGYVHLCGRGTVITPAKTKHKIGYDENITALISSLASDDQLEREAASTALGYLTKTPGDRNDVVPSLANLLKDDAMEVRRNAAEALGRIGDPRASKVLRAVLKDDEDWVREVAVHAIEQIETGQE